MTGLTDSRFNMWRCIVALAHADEVVSDAEKEFLQKYFDKLPLSDEQRTTLGGDLENAQNPVDLYKNITEPVDRSELIYFARLLMWSDGVFEEQEEKLLAFLKDGAISKIDVEKAMSEVEEIVQKEMSNFDEEHQARRQKGVRGIIESLADYFPIDV